jgi:hypothetical protein
MMLGILNFANKVFKTVYERLHNVLVMIESAKGGNAKAQENCSKLFCKLRMSNKSDESNGGDLF